MLYAQSSHEKVQASLPRYRMRGTRSWYLWRAFVRNRLAIVGAVITLVLSLAAIAAPVLAPYQIDKVNAAERLQPPSANHWLGTDGFGRDTLSRLLFGARVSLTVGILSTTIALIIGVLSGAVAGFWGGWLDEGIMRLMDVMLAFPYMVLAIIIVAFLGPGFDNLIWVLGIIRVPHFARITRGAVLGIKEREFVLAAHAVGLTPRTVLFRHILPNSTTPIIVYASLSIATAITAESALSFLGLGIQPPNSSWGTEIRDGLRYLTRAPWLTTYPGMAISLAVLGFNLLGDGLRDALDPHSIT